MQKPVDKAPSAPSSVATKVVGDMTCEEVAFLERLVGQVTEALSKKDVVDIYQTTIKIHQAMGKTVAKRINVVNEEKGPFPAVWLSFKFAMLHKSIEYPHKWQNDNQLAKKRVKKAIGYLDKLIEVIEKQTFRDETSAAYPPYFNSCDDLNALNNIKNNQSDLLSWLNRSPIKNYHVPYLDVVCGRAVELANAFDLGNASTKDDAPSPIERMLAVLIKESNHQELGAKINAARARHIEAKEPK